jgi:lysophospholipase L1-like esterase
MSKPFLKPLVILSFTLNIVAVIGAVDFVAKKGGYPWVGRKVAGLIHPQQTAAPPNNRVSVFEQLPTGPNDIIFLGDSILNFGEWHEFLKCERVKNRAISGDDTHTILDRLNQLLVGKPRHVVLLCGINNFQKRIPYAQTTSEYTKIVDTILSQSRQTEVWLLPVLPVNTWLYKQWIVSDHPGINMPKRLEVETLNSFIKTLAVVNKPLVHYVDTRELLDNMGELRTDFTLDGLHLNGRGLKEIAARLQQDGLLRLGS